METKGALAGPIRRTGGAIEYGKGRVFPGVHVRVEGALGEIHHGLVG